MTQVRHNPRRTVLCKCLQDTFFRCLPSLSSLVGSDRDARATSRFTITVGVVHVHPMQAWGRRTTDLTNTASSPCFRPSDRFLPSWSSCTWTIAREHTRTDSALLKTLTPDSRSQMPSLFVPVSTHPCTHKHGDGRGLDHLWLKTLIDFGPSHRYLSPAPFAPAGNMRALCPFP